MDLPSVIPQYSDRMHATSPLIFLMFRRLDQLELCESIYAGRASNVYVARDKQTGMEVALKMYRKKKLSALERWENLPQKNLILLVPTGVLIKPHD